jgi:hypothetical protein
MRFYSRSILLDWGEIFNMRKFSQKIKRCGNSNVFRVEFFFKFLLKANFQTMIEITVNDRLGKKVRIKCNPTDKIGDLKKLIAAQTGTK